MFFPQFELVVENLLFPVVSTRALVKEANPSVSNKYADYPECLTRSPPPPQMQGAESRIIDGSGFKPKSLGESERTEGGAVPPPPTDGCLLETDKPRPLSHLTRCQVTCGVLDKLLCLNLTEL